MLLLQRKIMVEKFRITSHDANSYGDNTCKFYSVLRYSIYEYINMNNMLLVQNILGKKL